MTAQPDTTLDGTFANHRMAKSLRVIRDGLGGALLEIDGEVFPFYTADGFAVHPQKSKAPSVTLTIVAERVEVIDDLNGGASVRDQGH